MRYYYTIYSVLDLHTYANSFYFADISDIVTYIDENLGDKEIYADCVDVEEFLYFIILFLLMSAFPCPPGKKTMKFPSIIY